MSGLEEQRKEKKFEIERLENDQGKTEDTTFIPECLRSVSTDIAGLGPRISGFLNVNKEVSIGSCHIDYYVTFSHCTVPAPERSGRVGCIAESHSFRRYTYR